LNFALHTNITLYTHTYNSVPAFEPYFLLNNQLHGKRKNVKSNFT